MKPAIKVAVDRLEQVPLENLHPLQGAFKTLEKEDYERLKSDILKDEFSFPVNAWEDPKTKKLMILDGHQRAVTLNRMKEEGYEIPLIPTIIVRAPNLRSAKRKLLAAASQFGRVNEQGLLDFLADMKMDAEELVGSFRFPELDLDALAAGMLGEGDEGDVGEGAAGGQGQQNSDLTGVGHVCMVQLFFNQETHPEFLQMCETLQAHFEKENITDTVMEAVRAVHRSIQEN